MFGFNKRKTEKLTANDINLIIQSRILKYKIIQRLNYNQTIVAKYQDKITALSDLSMAIIEEYKL
jgi:hypothetical protein